jgi:hypothetical protein
VSNIGLAAMEKRQEVHPYYQDASDSFPARRYASGLSAFFVTVLLQDFLKGGWQRKGSRKLHMLFHV